MGVPTGEFGLYVAKAILFLIPVLFGIIDAFPIVYHWKRFLHTKKFINGLIYDHVRSPYRFVLDVCQQASSSVLCDLI